MITGIGIVSSLGSNIPEYWSGMMELSTRPIPYYRFQEMQMDNKLCYPVLDDFNEFSFQRSIDQAVYAVQSALEDAGLLNSIEERSSFGVCIGTGMGAYDVLEYHQQENTLPLYEESFAHSRIGETIASTFGCWGPNVCVSTACSASGYSISLAAEMIKEGKADVVITGGTEIYTLALGGSFNRLGALDTSVCRPFDSSRTGTIFGEGSAILILESEEHATKRNSISIYGELRGDGWSCDGHHLTAPDSSGVMMERAVELSLRDSGIDPDLIDCILVHGTGTPLNDLTEGRTLSRFFGDRMKNIVVSSIKSKIGHLGGAAGAVGCLTAALILKHDKVPPTSNIIQVDEGCEITPIRFATEHKANHILVNAYAFGGNNISLVVSRYE